MCEIESTAYDFTKSILVDSEAMKFKASIVVAAIISVTLEIYLKLKLDEKIEAKTEKSSSPAPNDLPMLN